MDLLLDSKKKNTEWWTNPKIVPSVIQILKAGYFDINLGEAKNIYNMH